MSQGHPGDALVERYWTQRLVDLLGPGRWASRVGPLFARRRILRWLLPRPKRS